MLRELNFDPKFTLQIERNAQLNSLLLAPPSKVLTRRNTVVTVKTPAPSKCTKRRMTMSTVRTVQFNDNVSVYEVNL